MNNIKNLTSIHIKYNKVIFFFTYVRLLFETSRFILSPVASFWIMSFVIAFPSRFPPVIFANSKNLARIVLEKPRPLILNPCLPLIVNAPFATGNSLTSLKVFLAASRALARCLRASASFPYSTSCSSICGNICSLLLGDCLPKRVPLNHVCWVSRYGGKLEFKPVGTWGLGWIVPAGTWGLGWVVPAGTWGLGCIVPAGTWGLGWLVPHPW